jgi:hypothetical protein
MLLCGSILLLLVLLLLTLWKVAAMGRECPTSLSGCIHFLLLLLLLLRLLFLPLLHVLLLLWPLHLQGTLVCCCRSRGCRVGSTPISRRCWRGDRGCGSSCGCCCGGCACDGLQHALS